MNDHTIALTLYALGAVGLFQARAFVPAFVTALLLRYWGTSGLGSIDMLGYEPNIFTSDAMLITLGLLSALEIWGDKVPEVRQMVMGMDKPVKSIMAILTTAGISNTAPETATAGGMGYFLGIMSGLGVWWAAMARSAFLGLFRESDEDDDLGLQKLWSWAEDLWALLGPLLLVVFPLFMLLLLGLVLLSMAGVSKYARHREEQSKRPCPQCETANYPTALTCLSCKSALPEPNRITLLGGSGKTAAPDLGRHALNLIEHKRCPHCATRLKERKAYQDCPACLQALFTENTTSDAYLKHIDKRVPVVLVVTGLFSLIPVIGLIPGWIYAKLNLVAPYRRYLPRGKSLALRFGLKILFFILILIQAIPGLGGLALPIMAYISYGVYRRAYAASLN